MTGWNMDTLYGTVGSPRFRGDLSQVVTDSRRLERDIRRKSCSLVDALDRYQKILDVMESLSAFASAVRSVDTTDASATRAVSHVGKASLAVDHLHVSMLSFLASRTEEIHRLTEDGQPLASYRYVLEELLEEQRHTMDPELEAIASDLNRSGTDAFSRLQESVSANATVAWTDDEKKTATELRGYAFSPDRTLRALAFSKEISIWKEHQDAFAAALNGVKGATITLDGKRGYASPLARSLSQSRIDQATFDALLSTLQDNLPMFRRYLETKAKVLGVDQLAFYDLFAPVGKGGRTYTYEEAQQFVIRQMGAFSPKMGSFVTKAFHEGWVDPFPHQGKVGGAYDTAFPVFGQSRVMANFDGTYNGVSTFAHELGHAFHDSIVLPLPHLLRTYPMTLAETASIFSEFVALNGALKEGDFDERLSLTEHFLQDATQVCVDILCRFLFEQEVFHKRAKEELTADAFCRLMVSCQRRTYGELSVYHPYMWAVKSHYYSSDFSFYNYPYAFGQLFGLGLYAIYEKHPEDFEDTYVSLLSKTGSMSAMDVAASVGIDIRDPAFWQQGMDVIGSFVDRFADGCRL
jgi:pepF/M3 family oligoendopeptidase